MYLDIWFFLFADFLFELSFSSSCWCSPPFEKSLENVQKSYSAAHRSFLLANVELCCKTPIAVSQTYIPEHQLELFSNLLNRMCGIFCR